MDLQIIWSFFANNSIDFSLDPFVSSRASVVQNRLLHARRFARAGHYVRNCEWKLSTNIALKLFNGNFSAGSSCWLVREACTQRSKKYARRPRKDDPADAGAIFHQSHTFRVSRHIRFEMFLFSNSLTTYTRFFMSVANVNLIYNSQHTLHSRYLEQ